MDKMRISCAQMSPVLGDVKRNLEMHLDMIGRAGKAGAQLVCFPELSLTGYVLKDLVPQVAMRVGDGDTSLRALQEASRDIDVLCGFVEEDARHRYYIAAVYLSRGQVLHLHRKVYLPTYTMFEEGRYLAHGESIRAFDTRLGRVGVLICEDFWHMSSAYALWQDGADMLLLMSASPGRGLSPDAALGSSRSVELMNQMYATFLTDFVVHCNRVGFEDGLNFWGGSTVYGPDGALLAQAPYFEPTLLTVDLDWAALRRVRIQLPLLRDERSDLLTRELLRLGGDAS
jgi:predicted amidohydrolase